VNKNAMTRAEAVAQLTAPGAPFEMIEIEAAGVPMRVYRHTPASMREVFTSSLGFGDRMFLIFGATRWTFTEFGVRVRRLAAHLAEDLGIGLGDRVAIGMRNYPEWLIAFWATQYIGAVAVPLNAWWTGRELDYALIDSGARVLIIDQERWDRVGGLDSTQTTPILLVRAAPSRDPRVTDLADILDGPDPQVDPLPEIPSDAPSTIMYTSGTTGDPKGAIHTHRGHCTNLMNTALGAGVSALLRPDLAATAEGSVTVALQTFPFFHIGGMSGLYVATSFGMTLVLMHKWDAAGGCGPVRGTSGHLDRRSPHRDPAVLDELDRREMPATTLRAISAGGSPVPPTLITRMG
jgi:long-chain acyl-CoA synthetase